MIGNFRRRILYPLLAYGRKCTDTEPVKLAKTASAVKASFAGAGVQRAASPLCRGARGGSALLGSRGNAHWRVEGRQPHRVKGETPCPGKVDACVNLYWVLPDAKLRRSGGFAALPSPEHLCRKEEKCLKLTRHNGRSGKHGTYNPRHNDRRFDVENSEHIDAERARQNVYWDCYRGFTTHDFRENPEQPDFSFEEIERMYYYEHYADHVNAQNARNEKTRHIERNRTVDDLLKNNKTCPEESIYQIGTMEESVPPEALALIVSEFYEEFENRFGSHIHILDWALHLDEGTPHIHERHVFDCENRYGELCPQQEKALEELGIPLPKPEQTKGKHNNRKQTFDAVCRTILFDIAKRHGLHLEQEPSYGGREYLEKQDYILMKQKEQLAAQEQKLEELTLKIEDVDNLIDEVSSVAYDKAVELVTDEVKTMTHQEDIEMIEDTKVWLQSSERKAPQKERDYALARLDGIIKKIRKAMQSTLEKVKSALLHADKKQAVTEEIKKQTKPSIVESLYRGMEEQRKRDSESQTQKKQKKQDMEL